MNDINTVLPYVKLKFNIEHPAHEECYTYGYECAMKEQGEENNPFKENTLLYEQWIEGWWDGFYGEKPMFELSIPNAIETADEVAEAANDEAFQMKPSYWGKVLKITGVIAATALVGYQVADMVA